MNNVNLPADKLTTVLLNENVLTDNFQCHKHRMWVVGILGKCLTAHFSHSAIMPKNFQSFPVMPDLTRDLP